MSTTVLRIHFEKKNSENMLKPIKMETDFTFCSTEDTTADLRESYNVLLRVAKELENIVKEEEKGNDTGNKDICNQQK